ncbi:MAG: SCP2 sterol-binding domain-containing protein [Chloroflexi bacterium]|nr:SCP2 sterol-binding domain-containing protein [Chloroflexota bacterium]
MTTPAEIFANITERFDVEKAKELELTVAFNLTGDDGGQWAVEVANGKANVVEGEVDNPTATIKMDGGDYVKMTKGELNPMMAFMSGKIKVDGDLNSVMKFQQLFGM